MKRLAVNALLPLMLALTVFAGGALGAQTAGVRDGPSGKTGMILAVSWQPGFCETRPNKPECESQTSERPDATQFSLHGLWMMRKTYCGISEDVQAVDKKGDWQGLPEVALPAELKAQLAEAMPGMRSGLERHEWVKHGTCSGMTAGEYYAVSVQLLDELNGSAVRELFAGNIGKNLDEQAIRQAFDKSFGPGAGDRVKMQCRRDGERRIITELTIGLAGEATDATTRKDELGSLIQQAGETKFGCPAGIVDAVGLQ